MSWDDVEEEHKGTDLSYPLSPSALKRYMRCPKQYEFAYVKGLKIPPNFKMVFGSSIHVGLEANYNHKFIKKKDLPIVDVTDAFNDDIKKRVKKEGVTISKHELNAAVNEGVDTLTGYHAQVAKYVQPVRQPELELITSVPGMKRKIRGFIDLVADICSPFFKKKNVIRDTKTTTRMYSQIQADTDIQLTTYDYLLHKAGGIKSNGVEFDVILRGKAEPTFKPARSTRPSNHARFEEQVRQIQQGIERGIFYPTDNDTTCSWCGYRKLCHGARAWT